jgi:hypothetical protein
VGSACTAPTLAAKHAQVLQKTNGVRNTRCESEPQIIRPAACWLSRGGHQRLLLERVTRAGSANPCRPTKAVVPRERIMPMCVRRSKQSAVGRVSRTRTSHSSRSTTPMLRLLATTGEKDDEATGSGQPASRAPHNECTHYCTNRPATQHRATQQQSTSRIFLSDDDELLRQCKLC